MRRLRHWRDASASRYVYSRQEMTLTAIFSSTLRGFLRPLALLVCLAGLLTAQLALAADQVEDLSAIGTELAEADGCAPSALISGEPDDHERDAPSTHCQTCCFHHNGQAGATAAQVVHAGNDTSDGRGLARATRLTSAALSAEKDPPRA